MGEFKNVFLKCCNDEKNYCCGIKAAIEQQQISLDKALLNYNQKYYFK